MNTLLAIRHADLRVAIEIWLREEPRVEIVGIVSTFQALQTLVGSIQPDLLIVDLDLPGLAGFDWMRQTGMDDRPYIVALGSRHADSEEVLAAGANVFIEKGTSPREMIAVIRQLEGQSDPFSSPTEEEEL